MASGNYLIDGLDTATSDALRAILKPCRITAGEVLIDQGERIETIHFPTTAYLVNRISNGRGQTLQVTFVGREGVSGLAPFLADAPCSWSVVGQGDGDGFSGSAQAVRQLAQEMPSLLHRLLQLSHFYQAEAHQLALAATYESITARLASWLLTAFDAAGRNEIKVTQDEIAHHLGVQRTSVVSSYSELFRMGAVKLMRGRVTLTNEGSLRRASCGSYELIQSMGRDLGVLPREDEQAA
ncbi:Crp/Fnr family transcriptional regulator [Brevundimonas sp. NIBR11]|uniref:Crp/Fnr family transcriptional regulator n=1 Tax=Brevundimonas sp. NIBR11 TaxID=3015999 RepID=UPI0022F0170B|nr:Crp/Fnr family transcriptional regulator [Brevundimonas sp. NIBR11]WGM31524.1 hypothetical protein KKHFBJBL_01771 [Brevundimonas sp. NIBR11]